jgi:hypothetical protein
MEADHVKICKFERIDWDDYEQVAANIVEFSEDAVKAIAERHQQDSICA